ncbi:hypothetical protein OCU04_005555 [Sclerotinia nivalis]|uniref:Uncharacterized protein n=1 Tax=Sclerotinia nivalis TaxID=352851 RepID=A0A9X0DK26_9HELO|nr:hypothetical protein OCU04_005555 [Sclerotinia nivalis]
MDLQEDCPAPQESPTVLNNSELESNDGTDPKTVLHTLRRRTFDEGLRQQWNIHMAQGRIFGSLEIRGAYTVNAMDVLRGDLSSSHPKASQTLRRTLAKQALQRWEQSPAPAWTPGAKEERAFVKSYENMVRSLQHAPAEEVDNYFAYMKHRLRLATSNDGGKTLGPLLSELFFGQERNPKMENIAKPKLRDAQALDPERYGKLDTNFSIDVDNLRNEAWKNQVPRAAVSNAKGIKPPGAALLDGDNSSETSGINHVLGVTELAGQLPSKRKRPSEGEEDAQTLNSGRYDKLTCNSNIYANPIQDKMFESVETATKENLVAEGAESTTDNMRPFQFLSGMNVFGKKRNYSWMPKGCDSRTGTPGKANTQISDTSGTSPTTAIPDFTTPLTLLSGPKKRRKLSDDIKDES